MASPSDEADVQRAHGTSSERSLVAACDPEGDVRDLQARVAEHQTELESAQKCLADLTALLSEINQATEQYNASYQELADKRSDAECFIGPRLSAGGRIGILLLPLQQRVLLQLFFDKGRDLQVIQLQQLDCLL